MSFSRKFVIPARVEHGAPPSRTPAFSRSRCHPTELPGQFVACPRNQYFQFPGIKLGQSVEETRSISFSMQAKRSAFVVPAHLQSSPEFFVRHVQVALRLLDARVSEHQLNDPDVHAVREQPTRALVAQVVPAEVDLLELFAIPLRSLPSGLRLDSCASSRRVSQAVWMFGW